MLYPLLFGIFLFENNEYFFQDDQNLIHPAQSLVIDCTHNPSFILLNDGLNLTWLDQNQYYRYDEIVKYQINTYTSNQIHFYFDEFINGSPEQYLDKIKPLIWSNYPNDVYFHDNLNGIAIESSSKLFNDKVYLWIVFKTYSY